MKDLKEIAGVDIKLEDIGLVYDQNFFPVEAKARTYSEAKELYVEKEAAEQDLYFMYRYFEAVTDREKFLKADTEYDITVLQPGKIGQEFIKTAGHYHSYVPNTEFSYPEVYEVIEGEIEYLLQTRPSADGAVEAVIVVAEKGDKVVVPPGYGHISLNAGNDVAIESNLQKRDLPATADYEAFKVYNGGALYRTEKGWENNVQYNVKSLRKVKPKEKPEWGLEKGKPLYTSYIEDPEKFKFLTEPQNFDFSDVFEDIKDF